MIYGLIALNALVVAALGAALWLISRHQKETLVTLFDHLEKNTLVGGLHKDLWLEQHALNKEKLSIEAKRLAFEQEMKRPFIETAVKTRAAQSMLRQKIAGNGTLGRVAKHR